MTESNVHMTVQTAEPANAFRTEKDKSFDKLANIKKTEIHYPETFTKMKRHFFIVVFFLIAPPPPPQPRLTDSIFIKLRKKQQQQQQNPTTISKL